MIKAWLFGVGILFILAELGIWLKQFVLPLPIYILAGAFLAIASNYEKGLMALFREEDLNSSILIQTATVERENVRGNIEHQEVPMVTEAKKEQQNIN